MESEMDEAMERAWELWPSSHDYPEREAVADAIRPYVELLKTISKTRWNTMTEGCDLAAFAQREARRLLPMRDDE